MRSGLRQTVVWLASLFVIGPASASAQSGTLLVGHFTWGVEVSALKLCGTSTTYWISAEDELFTSLVSAYDRRTSEPYEEVYLRAAGWVSTEPVDGFAADYDGSWRLTRLEEMRPKAPGDCANVDPPIWLDSSTPSCDRPHTSDIVGCLTSELVTADGSLQDVVTQAQANSPQGPELYQIQRYWEAYRELQCTAVLAEAGEGTIRVPSMLNCRTRLARERAELVEALYLEGTDR